MELGIATQWPQLTLVACLDASPTYTEALEKEVRIDPKKTTNMTITLIKTKAKSKGLKNISAICKTFEAYESDTKFNLIVAVHAWYLFLLLFVHFFLLFFILFLLTCGQVCIWREQRDLGEGQEPAGPRGKDSHCHPGA